MEASSTIRTISWEDINLIGEEVGQGTNGYVHKAELISEGHRIVAVKRMHKDSVLVPAPEVAKEILLDEARLMSMLNHPNIVSFIGLSSYPDAGIADFPAIVMEYLPSDTLRNDAVHRAFPLRSRMRMALQIAEAMQYIHSNEKNIVHNDLTSSNIFLDLSTPEQPVCKLGDFGAGQEADKQSMVSKYEGDVHGFGVVLQELLAGESNVIDPTSYAVGLRSAVLMGKELVDDCSRKPPGDQMLRRKLPDSDEVVERLLTILDAIPAD